MFSVVDSRKQFDKVMIGIDHLELGTIGTWRQFNIVQWLFVGLALLEVAFTIYVAIVCIKKKPKLWGLWMVLIVSVYVGISFPTSGKPVISFFAYTFMFPKVLNYGDMISEIYLSVPICAIIFFVKHKIKNRNMKKASEESDAING